MFCFNCGKEIQNEAKFCPFCGTPQNDIYTNGTNEPDNEIVDGEGHEFSIASATVVSFDKRFDVYNSLRCGFETRRIRNMMEVQMKNVSDGTDFDGFYEKIILSNVTDIIPIVEPEDFAVESLTNFNTQIKKLKVQYDAKVNPCKYLVINKGNNQKQVHRYWTETLKESPYEVFEFHDSRAVSGSISYHVPMQEYQSNNPLCKTISQLAEKVK